MGVETFVVSTQDGIGFYKVRGFEHVMGLVLDPVVRDSENEELVKLKGEDGKKGLLPFVADLRVRPVGGERG
jgi:hypothetical protein